MRDTPVNCGFFSLDTRRRLGTFTLDSRKVQLYGVRDVRFGTTY